MVTVKFCICKFIWLNGRNPHKSINGCAAYRKVVPVVKRFLAKKLATNIARKLGQMVMSAQRAQLAIFTTTLKKLTSRRCLCDRSLESLWISFEFYQLQDSTFENLFEQFFFQTIVCSKYWWARACDVSTVTCTLFFLVKIEQSFDRACKYNNLFKF